jgi:hypothetical protein
MEKEILKLAIEKTSKDKTPLSFASLDNFPEPIQRYLRFALKEGSEPIYYAKLIHGGEFRTAANKPWFPIKGYYHYLADPPAFFWRGKIKPLPILSISARDYYYKGKGEVKIRLGGFIPMGKSSGPEINEASLIRFFSEMPLFPSVFLTSEYTTWQEIDSTSARLTFENEGLKVSGVFFVNDKGELVRVKAERATIVKKEVIMNKWTGYFSDFKTFGDVKVPTYFIAEWNLPEGDFQYAKFTVEELEFNNPQ